MGGFFKLDGPFFKYGTILADIFIVTILWFICSIPLITLGTSTTAVFYVTTKQTTNKDGYVTASFFKSFKTNFIQSVVTTLILTLAGIFIYISIRCVPALDSYKELILTLEYIAAFELIITALYIFPLMSRFDMKLKELFKTAFFLANRHMFTTITCLVLLIAIIFLCLFVYPVLLVGGIGAYAYASSFMFMRIFRQYCPDIDSDVPEQTI